MSSSPRPRLLVGAALIVLLGLLLRLYDLGGPSLWFDEGFTWWIARGPVSAIPAATVSLERAPPLHYAVVHAVLGWGQSEAALRAASVASGVLAIAATIWLAALAFGPREGGLAGLFLALSALHVMMSQDARAYAMAAFLVTLSTALWLRELKDPGRLANLAAYCAVAVLAIYTHYICCASVGLQWLCGVSPARRRENLPRLLAAALIVLAFVPWVPTMLLQGGRKSWGLASWTSFPDALFVQAAGFFVNFRSLWVWYGVAALALAMILLPPLLDRRVGARLIATVCGGTIGALIVISMAGRMGIYNGKFLVLVTPLFWALAARSITLLADRGMRLGAPLLAGALLMVNGISTANLLLFDEWHNQDWRGAIDQVARNARGGDLVLVEPEMAAPVVEYYWSRRSIPLRPVGVSAEMADSFAAAQVGAAPRVWLIEGEPGMVDAARRVERALDAARPRVLEWVAWRRNPSLTMKVTLYGPP